MGGPGSGGYKNKPGDTETHSAWDIIPQDPDGTQVNVVVLDAPFQNIVQSNMRSRNSPRYDASTVEGRWLSTPRASGCIC